MKRLLNWLAERRATALVKRVAPYLPEFGKLLDVGSGTGHNADALKRTTQLELFEADVVDMSVVGDGPVLFDGQRLPFGAENFNASLMLYVLQYPADPVALLSDVRRVTDGRVLVMQSTYRGRLGLVLLSVREFFLGRFAFAVARVFHFVRASKCPLKPRQFFTPEAFQQVAQRSGLKITHVDSATAFGLPVCRDLYVLEAVKEP